MASSGSPGSFLHSPSPSSPPARARCTAGACTCRLKASRSASSPSAAQAMRRFSSTSTASSPCPGRQVERFRRRRCSRRRHGVAKTATRGTRPLPSGSLCELPGPCEERLSGFQLGPVHAHLAQQRLQRLTDRRPRGESRPRSDRCPPQDRGDGGLPCCSRTTSEFEPLEVDVRRLADRSASSRHPSGRAEARSGRATGRVRRGSALPGSIMWLRTHARNALAQLRSDTKPVERLLGQRRAPSARGCDRRATLCVEWSRPSVPRHATCGLPRSWKQRPAERAAETRRRLQPERPRTCARRRAEIQPKLSCSNPIARSNSGTRRPRAPGEP